MLKKNKIILASLGSTIGIGAILVASVAPIVAKNNQFSNQVINTRMSEEDWNNNAPFEFNNKDYLSLDDAYNDFVNEINGINAKQFIGEINNKNEDGSIILTNNPVQEYDVNKILTAYMDANGRYTNDYDKAIKSFVNAANLVTNYYDYKGNYFLDEEDAKYSMDSFDSMGIAYYEIKDKDGNVHKINPLNSNDINVFKKIAYDSIVSKKENSPFALKIVAKDEKPNNSKTNEEEITYSKSNEITNKIVNQWNTFQMKFKMNLNSILQNLILNVLKNNNIIQAEIYIKPYVLKEKTPQEDCYDNEEFGKAREDSRFMWCFETKEGKQSLSFKLNNANLNYDELQTLMNIFMNLSGFDDYYEIKTKSFDRTDDHIEGEDAQDYEYAVLKKYSKINHNKEIYDLLPSKISTKMPAVAENFWPGDPHKVARILRESEVFHPKYRWEGGKFYHNYMLTFGVRPYINPDASIKEDSWKRDYNPNVDNKISFGDFINNLITPNTNSDNTNVNYPSYSNLINQAYQKTINELGSEVLDIKNFFNKYKFVNIIENPMSVAKDVYTQDIIYTNNIFNYDVVEGLSKKEWPTDTTYKTPQFDLKVYEKLCNKFKIDNIDYQRYSEFNSAIDMHQLSYYEKKWNIAETNDYLGDKNGVLTNSFISINNNISFKQSSSNENDLIQKPTNESNDNFKFIITYNDMPVFEINKAEIKDNKEIVKQLLESSNFITSSNNNQSTQTPTINELNGLFKNISINYSLKPSQQQTKDINRSNEYTIHTNKQFVKQDSNNKFSVADIDDNLDPPNVWLPNDQNTEATMSKGIFDTISLYNRNINKLGSSSKTNNDLISENKPTEFLMLFDKAGNLNKVTPTQLKYCETILGVDNINLSLTQNNISSKLAFNQVQLAELKKRLEVFSTPAKVYFIYNNDNLVIKNKIENNTNNPDFIDNPELVIENALRTYGLKKETDRIMYAINEHDYISLLNNVFVLYTYKLNDKDYYFDSYKSAKDKLISYIKYNSFKL